MRSTWLTTAVAVLFVAQGSHQLQKPRDCTPAVRTDGITQNFRLTQLSQDSPFQAEDTKPYRFYYPEVAAQYDLAHGCCPEGSYVVEWEVVLKTFYAPAPFDDGQLRSLNGSLLPSDFITWRLRSRHTGYNNYGDWNASQYQIPISWDDVQGIALTTLHNRTLLGSVQAKCGLKNGTIVAELPKIGANLTSDCLQAPGLTVVESSPIRLVNSSHTIFSHFFVNSHFKLPKNLQSETMRSLSEDVLFNRIQDSPYQDFMGLMELLGLSAENAPAPVDLAALDWRNTTLKWGVSDLSRAENYERSWHESAAMGVVGLAGCFGPMELVVVDDRLYIDNPPTPAVSSYGGCAFNSTDQQTYTLIGEPADKRIFDVSRFRNKPLVCCPEGEHVSRLDFEFRGDRGFSNPDSHGNLAKRLWSFTGICSRGTRLPEISAGDGCTGSHALLPPEDFTVDIPYDNVNYWQNTQLQFAFDGDGFRSLLGKQPNGSSRGEVGVILGGREHDYDYGSQQLRIVGLDATATCNGLASIGMVLRTRYQVRDPDYAVLAAFGVLLAAFAVVIAILKDRRNP